VSRLAVWEVWKRAGHTSPDAPRRRGRHAMVAPAASGEVSVLSVSIPAGECIQSESGRMNVKCTVCGSFNELVPLKDE
jgi:hypothetical protein